MKQRRRRTRFLLAVALGVLLAFKIVCYVIRYKRNKRHCDTLAVNPNRPPGVLVDIGTNTSLVAICLYGEARRFELSGLSIRRYVLEALPYAHIFLLMPLTRDSYKLTILASDKLRFVKARVFKPERLQQTVAHREVLGLSGSSHGLQGLLQYYSLVENCGRLISEYEREHGFEYEWIIKARLDTYWTAPIPRRYERGVCTVPLGNNWGGLNDKLVVGDRAVAMEAGYRLSMISWLHAHGYRDLWSEALFQAQIRIQGIALVAKNFSFCLLDHRRWSWPPDDNELPVVSTASVGPLNGAYCRPCRPRACGSEATSRVEKLCRVGAWFPTDILQTLEICDASQMDWQEEWEDVFDKAAGAEAAAARVKLGGTGTLHQCIAEQADFQDRWEMWDGPSPFEVCNTQSGNPWPKSTPTSTSL